MQLSILHFMGIAHVANKNKLKIDIIFTSASVAILQLTILDKENRATDNQVQTTFDITKERYILFSKRRFLEQLCLPGNAVMNNVILSSIKTIQNIQNIFDLAIIDTIGP